MLNELKQKLIIKKAELYQIGFEIKKLTNLYQQREIELVDIAARVETLQQQAEVTANLDSLSDDKIAEARI